MYVCDYIDVFVKSISLNVSLESECSYDFLYVNQMVQP